MFNFNIILFVLVVSFLFFSYLYQMLILNRTLLKYQNLQLHHKQSTYIITQILLSITYTQVTATATETSNLKATRAS